MKQNDVCGVIIEPVPAEGGDLHASDDFFRKLYSITKENNSLMIVDEVQTGLGATGKMWAHEHWGNDIQPDIVTWSKKFQVGGFHAKKELSPPDAYMLNSTWAGDPFRAALLESVLNKIERENLINKTVEVGNELKNFLHEQETKGKISGVRGRGTFLAFDMNSTQERDTKLKELYDNGILMGGCGTKSIRVRPA